MSKRKSRKIAIMPVIIGILLIILFSIFSNMNANNSTQENNNQPAQNTQENQGTETQDNLGQQPEKPQLVIPENPIGTLGLIFASIAALGLFFKVKNRKIYPKL